MKKKMLIFPIILGALLSIIELVYWNNKINYKELVSCTCLNKYKELNNSQFYLVLKAQKNSIIFDLNVTPETYYSSNVGNKLTFNLRKSDFDTNYKWIEKFIVLLIIGIIGLTAITIVILTDNTN